MANSDNLEYFWEQLQYLGRDRYADFEQLIRKRVRNILLVASHYDAFTLEGGGRLTELILSEYRELNLSSAPRITRATSGKNAMDMIHAYSYDLVITMTRIGEMHPVELARRVKSVNNKLPVMVLGYNERELALIDSVPDHPVDMSFVWTGDVKLLVAIIKMVEDRLNVADDTRNGDVRVIIVVEDSVRFYSSYLPLIYKEVMNRTQELMADGINLNQKLLRMRARPKILFATNFEEAWELYNKYRKYVLGAICDARFSRNGVVVADAGLEFIKLLKIDDPELPVVLQSSEDNNRALAEDAGVGFINKHSVKLHKELRHFMRTELGFGDFVFRLEDGTELSRASNTKELEKLLPEIPDESVMFHASHDHYSNWLRARTKFTLASMIKPVKASEFKSASDLRNFLIETLSRYRKQIQSGVVLDFSRKNFDSNAGFTRIGTGSLGGKARGLAFMNHVINQMNVSGHLDNVTVKVPPTAVVATDVFDEFLEQDDLRELALISNDDHKIATAFVNEKLPQYIMDDLQYFLEQVKYPLAIRSSSLLEDAQCQPFAGVYRTYMIPNSHTDLGTRLDQLCEAIKLVYASTFFAGAKSYLTSTNNRVEEEKMGVIIQQIVGNKHEELFYPDFAGAAHSLDHYPPEGAKPEDGMGLVALGLGRIVVEGGQCLRFSPRHPEKLLQFANVDDTLRNSQRQFQAVDISNPDRFPHFDEDENVVSLELSDAERHGTLAAVGSTYSAENNAIYEGIGRKGARIVTFAPILKSGIFPLPEVLSLILELGRRCMSCPVEIEYAGDIATRQFSLLQIRPLAGSNAVQNLEPALLTDPRAVVATEVAIGNGRYDEIRDIVYIPRDRFDRGSTVAIAQEIGRMNLELRKKGRSYILLGPGRWGSSDRWLGIPVEWSQINSASVIVETDLDDFKVTPSQGTHFFQNLTSFEVGYLTVNLNSGGGKVDWNWFDKLPVKNETKYIKHIELSEPLAVIIDGRNSRAVVLRGDK
jgi:hypothetical protein